MGMDCLGDRVCQWGGLLVVGALYFLPTYLGAYSATEAKENQSHQELCVMRLRLLTRSAGPNHHLVDEYLTDLVPWEEEIKDLAIWLTAEELGLELGMSAEALLKSGRVVVPQRRAYLAAAWRLSSSLRSRLSRFLVDGFQLQVFQLQLAESLTELGDDPNQKLGPEEARVLLREIRFRFFEFQRELEASHDFNVTPRR